LDGGSLDQAYRIQIDIAPSEIGRNYPLTVGLQGDAKVTVRRLIESLDPKAKKDGWAEYARRIVSEFFDEIEPLRHSNDSPIRVERLCKELTEILPRNGVVVACTGWSSVWTGTMVYMTHPEQRYIRAAGSLGWGFPASLGVKCGVPDRPVVCFTGDGGFWYHLSELETAARCGINTVTIVNNNHAFRQDLNLLRIRFGDIANAEEFGTFRKVNFAKVAEEMGCLGIRVERPEEIAGALERALAADRPVVVDVITDPACTPPRQWLPE
jgi:acetolactate synthase-1/2/3 large subunit